jgi:hypothetical protein
MNNRFLKLLVALTAATLTLLAIPGVGLANGAPVRVVLSYIEGTSNWGPKKALGALEIVKAEGEVTLTATGLTVLSNESYSIWLKNTKTGEVLPCGRFNADQNGDARYHNFLPAAVPDKGYDFAFLTVEAGDTNQTSASPSARVSLAGAFPPPAPPAGAVPSQLPVTGDAGPVAPRNDINGWLVGAVVALLILNVATTGLLLRRRKQ